MMMQVNDKHITMPLWFMFMFMFIFISFCFSFVEILGSTTYGESTVIINLLAPEFDI
jgi:hypothetical protein